jgi:thiamine biosynthesis lipoprotein
MWNIRFRAMGSEITAFIEPLNGKGPEALEQVPEWFHEWEARLSRFIETSELSQLNRSEGSSVPVSRLLWDLLQQSVAIAEFSGGLVTPLVLNTLESVGYVDSFEKIRFRGPSDIHSELQPIPAINAIRFDPSVRAVQLPSGERVDLGGFAKGWAADTASERLAEFGCVLIDAGGDISVNRPRLNGQPWLIGIENPLAPEEDIAILQILSGGVATSGKNRRRWSSANCEPRHHLIDPRSGSPAKTDVMTATVVGPSAMEAEAGSKTVFFLGSEEGMGWIESRRDLEALIMTERCEEITSSKMNTLIRSN